MLGIRMHREDAERTERWQGNRLVAFRGVTDKGDGPVEVKGEAHGDNFIITSPQGTTTAPWSVHPANPWSSNFLYSNTMMRPDTGKLEQVRIGSGQETAVKRDSANVPAVKYDVDGSSKYTCWLDDPGGAGKFFVGEHTRNVPLSSGQSGGGNAA